MKNAESGNILFYILIGVMMLAALSFAVTQGSRDNTQNLNQDKQRLLATEIIDYGDTIKKSVDAVRLRGVPLMSLSFADAGLAAAYGTPGTNPPDEIFNSSGGAAVYKDAAPDALDSVASQSYIFTAKNEIKDVGTTCAADACTELIMMLPALKKDLCVAINAVLGVDNPSGAPPTDSGLDATPFAGSATAVYADTIGDEAGSAALAGKTAGCFLDSGTGKYTFYQVLQAR
ncbi:MAG TPA: hypothetical protein VL625_01600 [Patescibacteria group bacterium]|jgi:hypothetical protein|nr:hypothetical protein [Patescibacteria group bacterium]